MTWVSRRSAATAIKPLKRRTTLYEPGMHLPCIVKTPSCEYRNRICGGLVTWADLTPTILDFAGTYDARNKDEKIQVHLEHRASADLFLRLRLVGFTRLAGRTQKQNGKFRSQDGRRLPAPAQI